MTDLELLFKKKNENLPEGEVGWQLIFTPPYCPKFQPIEMVWGYTKNDVALEYRSARSITDVYTDVMTAWYGGTGSKPWPGRGGR